MGLLVLIPILAIGYFFLTINVKFRYRINHLEGQHLYFLSASIGIFIYFCTIFLVSLLSSFSVSFHTFFNYSCRHLQHLFFGISALNSYLVLITIISFFLTVIVNYVYNQIKKYALAIKYNSNNSANLDLYFLEESLNSPIEKLLFNSAYSHKPIMLTMIDRKVYIGIVIQDTDLFNRFAKKIDEFDFLPLKSGFRDKDSLEVTITTNYKVDPQNPSNNSIIILKKSSILSCAEIELKLFDKFIRNLEPTFNKLIESQTSHSLVKITTTDFMIYWGKLTKNSSLESLRKSESIELEICAMGKINSTTLKISTKTYRTFPPSTITLNKSKILSIH